MSEFRFSLTDEEKRSLTSLVRASILQGLEPDAGHTVPAPPSQTLLEELGAFVTLKLAGELRGCIGHVIGDKPLWQTVAAMAKAAAFDDPRFPSLSRDEFDALEIEISILSPLTQCPDPALVEVGRHGLLINHRGTSGLLLPQVPQEWGWDRETFLTQTCFKAGLPGDAWRDPSAMIFWFEAEVF